MLDRCNDRFVLTLMTIRFSAIIFETANGDECNIVVFHLLLLSAGDVKLEKDDVAVAHRIRLALLSVLTGRLDLVLVTERLQIFESHDFGTDETSLEIGVNRPRGLGRLESLANAPRLDFVRTGGEKVNQMDGRKRRLDDFGKHGLHALVLTPLLLLLLGHRLQFALDLARKRNDDAAAVRLHPLVNFDQKLILLALKIPTTEIHQVNDRFRGEQLVRVQVRDVRRIPVFHAVAHLLSMYNIYYTYDTSFYVI